MKLAIRRSPIHADGVYATAPIKKRTIVVEYTGPRLTYAEADAIYEHSPRTYLFGMVDGVHVIDGDGIAAFINHSCDPNCEADEIKGRVIIRAIRNISASEELVYDYNLYDGDMDDLALCICGARRCRGSMYSEQELERRKKQASGSGLQASGSRVQASGFKSLIPDRRKYSDPPQAQIMLAARPEAGRLKPAARSLKPASKRFSGPVH